MKANGIPRLSIQPMSVVKNLNLNNDFVGFFGKELKTCATIEEGVRSFDRQKKVKTYAE